MVRIPKDLVETEDIRENQMVEIQVKKKRVSGFGLLKGLEIKKEHVKASDFD